MPLGGAAGGVDSLPPRHFSGLWLGEARPAQGMEHEVPVNPIKWSLTLCPAAAGPSAFGAGFFDDAGDIPGQPVLFFVLKGEFVPETSSVKITKEYCNRNIPEALKVEYDGKLQVPRDARETQQDRGRQLAHACARQRLPAHDRCHSDLCLRPTTLNAVQVLPDGQPALAGTWVNALEGTRGSFACRLEE